jgi:hypothetical protein
MKELVGPAPAPLSLINGTERVCINRHWDVIEWDCEVAQNSNIPKLSTNNRSLLDLNLYAKILPAFLFWSLARVEISRILKI